MQSSGSFSRKAFLNVYVFITDLQDCEVCEHTLASLALQLRDSTCVPLSRADNSKQEEAVAKSPLYVLSSMLVTPRFYEVLLFLFLKCAGEGYQAIKMFASTMICSARCIFSCKQLPGKKKGTVLNSKKATNGSVPAHTL